MVELRMLQSYFLWGKLWVMMFKGCPVKIFEKIQFSWLESKKYFYVSKISRNFAHCFKQVPKGPKGLCKNLLHYFLLKDVMLKHYDFSVHFYFIHQKWKSNLMLVLFFTLKRGDFFKRKLISFIYTFKVIQDFLREVMTPYIFIRIAYKCNTISNICSHKFKENQWHVIFGM